VCTRIRPSPASKSPSPRVTDAGGNDKGAWRQCLRAGASLSSVSSAVIWDASALPVLRPDRAQGQNIAHAGTVLGTTGDRGLRSR